MSDRSPLRLVETDQLGDVPADWRTYVWQGPEWQRLLRAYGLAAWFVRLHDASDRLVAYAMVQEHAAGALPRYWARRAASTSTAVGPRVLRVVHGPVVGLAEDTLAVHHALAAYLDARAARWNVAEILVKPPHYPADRTAHEGASLAYASRRFAQTSAHTFIVPSDQPLDALRQRLAGEKRTKLNRAAREGIRVVHAQSEADVERYWKIRGETMRRAGQFMVPLHHHLDTWRALRPGGAIEILIAERDGEDLAAQILYLSKLDVELVGSATADANIQRSLPGNDALQWAVIEWAHANGYRHVDYVGADPNATDPKRQEIHRFKKSWGGAPVEYPQFVWRRPIAHWFYRGVEAVSSRLARGPAAGR